MVKRSQKPTFISPTSLVLYFSPCCVGSLLYWCFNVADAATTAPLINITTPYHPPPHLSHPSSSPKPPPLSSSAVLSHQQTIYSPQHHQQHHPQQPLHRRMRFNHQIFSSSYLSHHRPSSLVVHRSTDFKSFHGVIHLFVPSCS